MDSLINKAIKQIKEKNYGERFLNDLRQRVYLGVGVLGKEINYKTFVVLNSTLVKYNE